MTQVNVDVEEKQLPQLVVMSAIVNAPGNDSLAIDNHVFLARTLAEIDSEVEAWLSTLADEGARAISATIRVVPREVFAPLFAENS